MPPLSLVSGAVRSDRSRRTSTTVGDINHIARVVLMCLTVDILRYALTLEHLENAFYRDGLANFTQADFTAAGWYYLYENLQDISAHEAAHVEFLTAGLQAAGVAPVQECEYAFGVTTVDQFIATASILEGVGVSAYLGAAKQIANKAYLTAAGSILTVEARHSSWLRAALAKSPFPQPYDNPLSPNGVYTLASGFIVSCPEDNPTIPLRSFPGLTVTTTGAITSGRTIDVQTSEYVLALANAKVHLAAAFITANGPVWANMTESGDGMNFQVTVPEGVYGQSYLLFSNCNETVSDETVVAGPALVEISKAAGGQAFTAQVASFTNTTLGANATFTRRDINV
ncbi:hypothetical protein LTR37_002954 [Vermiconidia calcicola]|uniref:Uncharacterized protein n=1 Tax=Vermiconidia calcicola TaxID=1690605 RepID=A0ACC3NSP3_9PEZI|nr:hypothetical protein LTR37_002954 [Vermiconidia calcicola]